MNFLLDTNICIALIKNRPTFVRSKFEQRLAAGLQIVTSTVTVFELMYGAAKSSLRERNESAINALLSSLSTAVLLDTEDAKAAAQIRAKLEKAGTPIGLYDLLIAGQAISRDLILVCANEREFSRIPGLRWENWAV